jgi:hypothetical protein
VCTCHTQHTRTCLMQFCLVGMPLSVLAWSCGPFSRGWSSQNPCPNPEVWSLNLNSALHLQTYPLTGSNWQSTSFWTAADPLTADVVAEMGTAGGDFFWTSHTFTHQVREAG